MNLRFCVSIVLGLVSHAFAQNAQAIGTLFQVDFSTNLVGGCAYIGQSTMQAILQDSLDLLGIGTQLVSDYNKNVGEARRLLDSFFQVTKPPMSIAQQQAIATAFQRVATWIVSGGPVNNGQELNKPYLFCYHSWLQKQTMSYPALDKNGKTLLKSGSQIPLLLNQIPEYVTRQKEEADAIGLTNTSPYWSPLHKEYMFDRAYSGSMNAGACTGSRYLGVTQHALSPSSITICPKGFGATDNSNKASNLATAIYVKRRSVAVNPIPKAKVPSGVPTSSLQQLSNLTPTAVTFLHELFHLVLGNDATYAPGGEIYELLKPPTHVVGLAYESAVVNPESYALAAVAYDYTLSNGANAAGNKVEFFAGYATQG